MTLEAMHAVEFSKAVSSVGFDRHRARIIPLVQGSLRFAAAAVRRRCEHRLGTRLYPRKPFGSRGHVPSGRAGFAPARRLPNRHLEREEPMKHFKSKKALVLLAALAVVAVAASIGAYAYFTTGGTGSGSATAGNDDGRDGLPDQRLGKHAVSGWSPEDLSGDFTNPNPNTVSLASVTAAVTGITGAGTDSTKPACTTADFTIGGSTGPIVVPAHAATHVGSWSGLTISLVDNEPASDPANNQDNCKGADRGHHLHGEPRRVSKSNPRLEGRLRPPLHRFFASPKHRPRNRHRRETETKGES